MVVESLLGAAWAYGSSAYSYNMGRYQFDSGQKQNTAHQVQNVRISLWSLFREDVRDLFGITTSNLSTYMLIGTLFLGFTTNMIWNVMNDFPTEPPFLVLFYCNCLYASTAYGVLSVWLAMHGTIAAHSASVKVLTQAVRPPIPTAKDVSKVGYDLSQYEASPSTMLQAPNVLGWQQRVRQDQAGGESNRTEDSSRKVQLPPQTENSLKRVQPPAPVQLSADGIEEDDSDNVAGPSALLGDHVQIFRNLQPTYLTFEAYSRVCLTVSAHELLILFAYYIMANFYTVANERTNQSKHPALASWGGVLFLAFTGLLLFKLDLFVEKTSMRVAKLVLLGAPLFTVLSVALWSQNEIRRRQNLQDILPDWVAQFVALLACILHLLLEGLLLWEARPHGEAKLPTCFRSVQYTDLFGWWYESATAEAESRRRANSSELSSRSFIGAGEETSCATDHLSDNKPLEAVRAARQISRLSRKVSGALSSANLLEHMTPEDVARLTHLNSSLELQSETLRQRVFSTSSSNPSSVPPNEQEVWLQCQYDVDAGHDVIYFVNSSTGEVQWETPAAGQVLNVDAMTNTAHEICSRASRVTMARSDDASSPLHARPSQQVRFGTEVELCERGSFSDPVRQTSARSRGSTGNIKNLNFEPLRRRPNSRFDSSSMAWKYFAQVTIGVVLLWGSTFVWILLFNWHTVDYMIGATENNQTYNHNTHSVENAVQLVRDAILLSSGDSSSTISMQAEQVTIHLPHPAFRPTALACSETDILLGEQYAIYTTHLEPMLTEEKSIHRFAPVLRAPEIPVPWRAFSKVSLGDRIFLLDSEGLVVYERGSASSLEWRRWHLGRSCGFQLLSFTAVEGPLARTVCAFLGESAAEWALYGVTSVGEVVSLCPSGDNLEPVHVILERQEATEIRGISLDYDGNLWVVSLGEEAQLYRFSPDGGSRERWKLPAARHWTTGICSLRNGDLLLLAVAPGPRLAKSPELWHLRLDTSSIAVPE